MNRTVALMQPYLFPYIGYFQLIHSCDVFGFRNDVQWIKGGWINRNRIWNQDKAEWLTVPVEKVHSSDRIFEVKIADPKYKTKLLRTANRVFWNAPNLELVLDLINSISHTTWLTELVEDSIDRISYQYLHLNKPLLGCHRVDTGNLVSGQDRVIGLVKEFRGDRYVNMVGGRELYHEQDFKERGLDLKFLVPNTTSYRKDNSGQDVPGNLSILDMLAYLDIEDVRRGVTDYVLE